MKLSSDFFRQPENEKGDGEIHRMVFNCASRRGKEKAYIHLFRKGFWNFSSCQLNKTSRQIIAQIILKIISLRIFSLFIPSGSLPSYPKNPLLKAAAMTYFLINLAISHPVLPQVGAPLILKEISDDITPLKCNIF